MEVDVTLASSKNEEALTAKIEELTRMNALLQQQQLQHKQEHQVNPLLLGMPSMSALRLLELERSQQQRQWLAAAGTDLAGYGALAGSLSGLGRLNVLGGLGGLSGLGAFPGGLVGLNGLRNGLGDLGLSQQVPGRDLLLGPYSSVLQASATALPASAGVSAVKQAGGGAASDTGEQASPRTQKRSSLEAGGMHNGILIVKGDDKPKEVVKKDRQKCSLCPKTFRFPNELRRHFEGVHDGIKSVCDVCFKSFSTKCNLQKHKAAAHEGRTVKCKECDKRFTDPSNLRKHTISIHRNLRYACPKCDKKFTQNCHLRTHVKSFHETVRFGCNACSRTFTRKEHVLNHLRSAHNTTMDPADIQEINVGVESVVAVNKVAVSTTDLKGVSFSQSVEPLTPNSVSEIAPAAPAVQGANAALTPSVEVPSVGGVLVGKQDEKLGEHNSTVGENVNV